VSFNSRIELGFGVVVPIPTLFCAKKLQELARKSERKKKGMYFFIMRHREVKTNVTEIKLLLFEWKCDRFLANCLNCRGKCPNP
jgi:hypothetical protein